MKPISCVLFFSVLFVACKKETTSSRNEIIVGEWTLKAEGYDQNTDGLLQNNEIDTPAAGTQIFEVYRGDGTGDFIVRIRGQQDDNKSLFKWFFSNGEKDLNTVRGIDTGIRTIIKLEGNRMERYDVLQSPRFLQILEK